ncbi:unnamed protein product, partial [Ixodes hexagonus]
PGPPFPCRLAPHRLRVVRCSGGRPPYSQTNGRRSQSGPRGGDPPEAGSLQHEALVRYLHTSWKGVCNELELQQ